MRLARDWHGLRVTRGCVWLVAEGRACAWQEIDVKSRGTVKLEIALGNRMTSGLGG